MARQDGPALGVSASGVRPSRAMPKRREPQSIDTGPRATWTPTRFDDDPLANAVLNVAAQLAALARATDGLIYGLKYSKGEGKSIAEAIEVASGAVATSIDGLVSAVADR